MINKLINPIALCGTRIEKKKHGTNKIFVGGLDKRLTTEDSLHPESAYNYFKKYGEIVNVAIQYDRFTQITDANSHDFR